MARQSLRKEIIGVTPDFIQWSHQKPGAERGYTSINTASLDLRGQRWDRMKESYCASGILQDRTLKLSSYKYAVFFKKIKGKNNPKSDSEISRAPTAITGLGSQAVSC